MKGFRRILTLLLIWAASWAFNNNVKWWKRYDFPVKKGKAGIIGFFLKGEGVDGKLLLSWHFQRKIFFAKYDILKKKFTVPPITIDEGWEFNIAANRDFVCLLYRKYKNYINVEGIGIACSEDGQQWKKRLIYKVKEREEVNFPSILLKGKKALAAWTVSILGFPNLDIHMAFVDLPTLNYKEKKIEDVGKCWEMKPLSLESAGDTIILVADSCGMHGGFYPSHKYIIYSLDAGKSWTKRKIPLYSVKIHGKEIFLVNSQKGKLDYYYLPSPSSSWGDKGSIEIMKGSPIEIHSIIYSSGLYVFLSLFKIPSPQIKILKYENKAWKLLEGPFEYKISDQIREAKFIELEDKIVAFWSEGFFGAPPFYFSFIPKGGDKWSKAKKVGLLGPEKPFLMRANVVGELFSTRNRIFLVEFLPLVDRWSIVVAELDIE